MVARRRQPRRRRRAPIRRRRVARRGPRVQRNPISRTATVRLKYCQYNVLNPAAAGVPAYHYFRLNSINDPDFTGTGHQPMGHDTYQSLYTHYYVVSAKVTCYFTATSAVGTDACIVGMRTDNDATTTPSGGLNELTEQASTSWAVIGNRNNRAVSKLTKTFNTSRFFGSIAKWNRAGLGADFGANPSTGAYLQIFAAPIDATVDAAAINIYTVIQYTVLFTEPKELSLS